MHYYSSNNPVYFFDCILCLKMNLGDMVKTALNGEYDDADSRSSSGTVKPCSSSQHPLFLGCSVPRWLGPGRF